MKVIKDNGHYAIIDVRNTHHCGKYQLLETTEEYPEGQTCGEYFNLKDAIKDFNKLSKSIGY